MDLTAHKKSLRKLMLSRAPDSSLLHVGRGLLIRYLEIAENGVWPLAEASSLDATDIAKNLSFLFGIYVDQVRFVSLSDPFGDLEWITEEQFARFTEDEFPKTLDNSLDDYAYGTYGGRLRASLDHRFLRGLGERRREIVDDDVVRTFKGLRSAVFATAVDVVGVRRSEDLAYSVDDMLGSFLSAIALDDRDLGIPLGHMTRILTKTLPLGMKRDEPGTWLFLTN